MRTEEEIKDAIETHKKLLSKYTYQMTTQRECHLKGEIMALKWVLKKPRPNRLKSGED